MRNQTIARRQFQHAHNRSIDCIRFGIVERTTGGPFHEILAQFPRMNFLNTTQHSTKKKVTTRIDIFTPAEFDDDTNHESPTNIYTFDLSWIVLITDISLINTTITLFIQRRGRRHRRNGRHRRRWYRCALPFGNMCAKPRTKVNIHAFWVPLRRTVPVPVSGCRNEPVSVCVCVCVSIIKCKIATK